MMVGGVVDCTMSYINSIHVDIIVGNNAPKTTTTTTAIKWKRQCSDQLEN